MNEYNNIMQRTYGSWLESNIVQESKEDYIKRKALEIYNILEENPEIQREFNLILRSKKIEKLKNNMKK